MALPESSLSQACKAIADLVSTRLKAAERSTRVLIGSPSAAAPALADSEHHVNLFFYRIEPAGLFTGGSPGDLWWLRLHCLVTAFGVAEDKISAGENDLRLLGEVMRLFHEAPLLPPFTIAEEQFRLDVVFLPVSIDDLNHIWSTQSEVSYRTSVVYEMSLAPVIPSQRRPEEPLVGSIGSEVRAAPAGRTAPLGGAVAAPPVARVAVDVADLAWAPAICFVDADGHCSQSLAFATNDPALPDFRPAVWIAGEPGADVELAWQRWTSAHGWKDVDATVAAKASTSVLDPELASAAVTEKVDLPAGVAVTPGQALLFARRRYLRPADQVELTVRSNPLLITVYGGA